MISHHMLSNDEYLYITSQKSKLPEKYNIAQMRKRIETKINRAFKTFELIINSKELSQQYKDNIFPAEKIASILKGFTKYDDTSPIMEEENKQDIARELLYTGVQYFQSRYKKPRILFDEFFKMNKIVEELDEMSRQAVSETEGMELYRLRSRLPSPPLIGGSKMEWYALCIHCYNYASGNTKNESWKNLRHEKRCTYNKEFRRFKGKNEKRVIEQYIKFIPPIANKK